MFLTAISWPSDSGIIKSSSEATRATCGPARPQGLSMGQSRDSSVQMSPRKGVPAKRDHVPIAGNDRIR